MCVTTRTMLQALWPIVDRSVALRVSRLFEPAVGIMLVRLIRHYQ